MIPGIGTGTGTGIGIGIGIEIEIEEGDKCLGTGIGTKGTIDSDAIGACRIEIGTGIGTRTRTRNRTGTEIETEIETTTVLTTITTEVKDLNTRPLLMKRRSPARRWVSSSGTTTESPTSPPKAGWNTGTVNPAGEPGGTDSATAFPG